MTSKTDRKKQIYSCYLKNGKNLELTAKELSLSSCYIRKVVGSFVNEEEMDVKSTSTLYDKDGNVTCKWIKSDTSKNQIKKAIKEFADEYSKKIPKYIPSNQKYRDFENKLVVYPLADAHIGMLSWCKETGCDWNTQIAEDVIVKTVTKIIDKSPRCKECLICNLGDLFHVDNQVSRTPTNGNVLDTDSRYAKLFKVGVKIMRYFIEYALQKHQKVTVINCIGNHDPIGSYWIQTCLHEIYEKEKRIQIIDSPAQRQYYVFGKTLIGFTHGSNVKGNELPLIMATEKPEQWGNTKFHYWYTGHYHQDKIIELGNCKVECFRALCTKDAWTASHGYNSGRDIKAIVIDKENGEVERYILNIE